MKLPVLLVLVSSLSLGTTVARPEPGQGKFGARRASQEQAGNEVLEAYMEDLQRSLRSLQKKLDQAEVREEVIAEVCRLQKVAIDAKGQVPSRIAAKPEEERSAERVAYRKQMQEVVRTLLDLEGALLDDDAEAAMEHLRALDESKQRGHDRFKAARGR